MAINFDLNDLLAFRAVAELSSFRKAAESVHLSQPAFSRRIDKLEQALGVRLLERTTRRVTLTAVGRDFERKVRELLDELDATLLGIRGVAVTRMGEVTVACVPSTVYYYLSQVIRRYHERCPKVRVKVLDASANEVLAAVARGEADFGLNFIGSQEGELEFKPLVEELADLTLEVAADGGQRHATRRSFEQPHAERLLELVDAAAERRLREMHRLGCLAEAAQLRDRTKGEQVVQVEGDRHGGALH